ncbi:uncharacterized protein I206_102704 [Kwoniella pini CBS 10737]|uniref:Uncharacterized protein n=1 Tax=Kwoniella pini CBS 10737 TaxID=1296096 RepID=A0A1B9I643_9TREE|nr:uncharacterized protein I206_03057 [Kwoniella pini CBS 10737]OCF50994.1 hypothetical protein I206_03057 [Kwoniella pini CBS 10737]
MDRQLKSPILIEQIGSSTKLSNEITYQHLFNFLNNSNFNSSTSTSVSKIQLERLNDALGVSIGKINMEEEERRENERKELRLIKKLERRKLRLEKEEALKIKEQEKLNNLIENLEEPQQEENDELESGAVKFENELQMDDKGDVEYGDNLEEDEDEPDNEHEDKDQDGDAKMESD